MVWIPPMWAPGNMAEVYVTSIDVAVYGVKQPFYCYILQLFTVLTMLIKKKLITFYISPFEG